MCERIVRSIAARYKRRCWWADVQDLEQVGFLAVLEAAKRWEPEVGVPRDAYLIKAIVFAMKRELWKNSAPVSGGLHRPEEQLAGLVRAPVDNEAHAATSDPEQDLINAQWRAIIRSSLLQRFSPVVVDILLEERTSKEVAQSTGVPVRSVYNETASARAQIAGDVKLWNLLKERKVC